MPEQDDLIARLRKGDLCAGDRCRVMDARSGCACAAVVDRIEQLQAEYDQLREQFLQSSAQCIEALAKNAQLQAENARLTRDAERYRFARMGSMTAIAVDTTGEIINAGFRYASHQLATGLPEKIDAEIDAAMQAQKESNDA